MLPNSTVNDCHPTKVYQKEHTIPQDINKVKHQISYHILTKEFRLNKLLNQPIST